MGELIKVPYIKQPKNYRKCGAACAAMVIKFYDNTNVDIDTIWKNIIAISPELGGEYCRTYKIGAYISSNFFNCCIVRYTDLRKLLQFCNENGIAPILNHKSFENNTVGHFSVVKNIFGDSVILNDPENKKRVRASLSRLELLSKKDSPKDEVGGNVAIVPILDKFPVSEIECSHCGALIDTSLSSMVNTEHEIISANLCLNCDCFN